jgi:hypothetical protein
MFSPLPSSAAHLPVFPHKEQWRKQIYVRGPAKSQPPEEKRGKFRSPAEGPSSISDSGENLNGCNEIHLLGSSLFPLHPATEGFFF